MGRRAAGGAITGMALMVLLADGEDPNFGKHKLEVQRAVRNLIQTQDPQTGFIPSSMYHHGFAMLALAEAYGRVDDSMLWEGGGGGNQRSIGEALELAVRCTLTAQKINQFGAWRYSPSTNDADTSVSGAVLVGLLAARNAGIEVPDENVDKALAYFQSMTTGSGEVGYSGGPSGGQSMNRSAIATLVFSIGKRKDWPQFAATSKYIAGELNHQEGGYPQYFRYYMAQALFQSDFEAWKKWKRENAAATKELAARGRQLSGQLWPRVRHGHVAVVAGARLSLAADLRTLAARGDLKCRECSLWRIVPTCEERAQCLSPAG